MNELLAKMAVGWQWASEGREMLFDAMVMAQNLAEGGLLRADKVLPHIALVINLARYVVLPLMDPS